MPRKTIVQVGAALVLLTIAFVAMAVPAWGSQPATKVYLPAVYVAPPLPAGCQAIPGANYGALSVNPPPTNPPAAVNPDLNIEMRGWQQTNAYLGLVTYNGSPDASAPQLWGLFTDSRVPVFSAVYQVYDWNWQTNTRGSLYTTWPVTLAGFQVQPREIIQTPPSGYNIGSGYTALVLYATTNQITLKYTRDDNVVSGYTIHVEGVCVEPSLLALYNQWNSAGRGQLPALANGQPLGRANGNAIDVAIRDSGSFMDPRSHNDWWRGH